ncbi:hypothetical protein PV416_05155, partial [Streptomyces ipomoeae]|nr:hypothetical protein [Streptomyces ipomoeae]MDX2874802.1 hypothetical protein [Streptomyces ipomoeae]
MDGIVFGLCALFGIAGTALSAREAWRQRSRNEYRVARVARTIWFGVCTIGVTFAVPSVETLVESATGMNNAAKLGAHICAVLCCGSIQTPSAFRTCSFGSGWVGMNSGWRRERCGRFVHS